MQLFGEYKDDILNTEKNTRRRYRMISNGDGTVSFEDVTSYLQNGDAFGAANVNEIVDVINSLATGTDFLKFRTTQVYVSTFKSSDLLEDFVTFDDVPDRSMVFVQLCSGGASNVVTEISTGVSVQNNQVKISVRSNGAFKNGDTVYLSVLTIGQML